MSGLALYTRAMIFLTYMLFFFLSCSLLAAPQNDGANHFERFYQTVPFTEKTSDDISLDVTSNELGIIAVFEIDNVQSNSSSQITPKDLDILDDYVELVIDFSGDGNAAYGFRVSKNGSTNDFSLDNEIRENRDWDGVWHSQSELDDGEWRVEIVIPWTTTVFTKQQAEHKEIKFYAGVWQHASRTKLSFPAISDSHARYLGLFHPVSLSYKANSQVSIIPFITWDKDLRNNSSNSRIGATFIWKDGDQSLSYAFRPDFGQVESSELVLNLSGIETFFSEKRRFFLDEQELYSVTGPENLRIFHSPRIGSLSGPNDKPLNIEHAIKYSKVFEDFEAGAMVIEEEGLGNESGRRFSVVRARVSKDMLSLGYLFTATDTALDSSSSQVNTVDFKAEVGDDADIFGFISHSYRSGNAIPLEQNTGMAFSLGAKWESSRNWSNEIQLLSYERNFNLSDMGFVARVDRKQLEFETSFELPSYPADSLITSSEHGFEYQLVENQSGKLLGQQFSTESSWVLKDRKVINFEIELATDFFDDHLTRGNNIVLLPKSFYSEIEFESSPDNDWLVSGDIKFGEEGLSGRSFGLGGTFGYSLNDNVSLGLGFDRVEFDSYLLWDEENTVNDYVASETEFEFFVNARLDNIHFLDLKLESVALKANVIESYEAISSGNLQINNESAEDLSIGELAMSVRYRFQPSISSTLYCVYSRGGETELDSVDARSHRLIRKAYLDADITSFFIKYEHSF